MFQIRSRPVRVVEFPQYELDQQDADWYQCTRENTTTGAEISSLGGSTEVRRVENTNMEMVVQCMKARGYTLTGVESGKHGAAKSSLPGRSE
jgi:hypothetical protein